MALCEPHITTPSSHSQWLAGLHMQFTARQGRTQLQRTERVGPLSVQRAFYPEANGTAHLYLLHPPAGIVSGDELHISAKLDDNSQALLTTPGANRFYRARHAMGNAARQYQYTRLTASQNASLEYLPHETLVYANANAISHTEIHLTDNANYIGWEIACLGLPHIQQPFSGGQFQQVLSIYFNHRIRFHDRLSLNAGDPVTTSRIGLAGHHVSGTMIVFNGKFADESSYVQQLCQIIREATSREQQSGTLAVTALQGVVVVRYLGDNSEQCRTCFAHIWSAVRPEVSQRTAVPPRIWFT